MSNGIFHVSFRASTGDYGDGLVVAKEGSVNGGDAYFLYQGSVPNESGPFEAQFKISKWKDGNSNVVGIDNYTLNAKGHIDYEGGTIELRGAVDGSPQLTIQISGRKIAEAM